MPDFMELKLYWVLNIYTANILFIEI